MTLKVNSKMGKDHNSGRINISCDLIKDSEFPFQFGEKLIIRIVKGNRIGENKLVITRSNV